MQPLTGQEILAAWEAGWGRPPTERALALLASACPETSRDELAALPVGERDGRLLTLREWTFGPALTSLATCPACSESLELRFDVADVRVPPPPPADEGVLSVKAHGYEVTFRLPGSADLAALEGVEDRRRQLLCSCVLGARRKGRKQAFRRLPARVLDAVVERMSEADPQADVHTELACPDCGHSWQAVFDVVTFFWEEIESWVHRTLRDVHVLAAAYGWRESEVLALSPWRRRYYLQLATP